MRFKVFVALATNITVEKEFSSKLGYQLANAYILSSQEMVNVLTMNNYKLSITHRFSTYSIICFLLL